MADRSKKPRKRVAKDIAVLAGPTEDGQGARLLRFRDGAVSAGEVRPAREGQPVGDGELVRLKPLHSEYPVCEVEVLHAPRTVSAAERTATGPARVATPRYRRNWNTVFGRGDAPKQKSGSDWSVN